jgi:hypothetical protein
MYVALELICAGGVMGYARKSLIPPGKLDHLRLHANTLGQQWVKGLRQAERIRTRPFLISAVVFCTVQAARTRPNIFLTGQRY